MSNEKFEKYKKLYSEYIDYAVKLHNYHQVFINHVGEESGKAVRTCLRNMLRLEKQLQKASLEAWKERKQNLRQEKTQRKADLEAWKRANPKKMGRPKKDKSNDNNKSTTSPV